MPQENDSLNCLSASVNIRSLRYQSLCCPALEEASRALIARNLSPFLPREPPPDVEAITTDGVAAPPSPAPAAPLAEPLLLLETTSASTSTTPSSDARRRLAPNSAPVGPVRLTLSSGGLTYVPEEAELVLAVAMAG